MKVSIIIPCYKQAHFLSEAIVSAVNQSYKDIEVIVINDGSPDNTNEIAGQFPVKVINQVNKGLASARNTGIMNATGDYILPLDADDILLLTAVDKIAGTIKASQADVIGLSFRCFGLADQDVILRPNPTLEDFKKGNCLPYCSAIKRSALLEVGGYSPKMDMQGGWEDLHLWYDLLLRNKKIVTIPDICMLYRTKTSSMWTETKKNEHNLWKQIITDFPQVKDHAKA